jgi:LacI family repressor for deo operon, udp, cdd, tsx, nupC, and nupG
MGRATIDDVARIAGVSIATVSRCLRKPQVVAEPTRRRVLEAVRDTGYAPSTAAQSLRARRSHAVLVLVPDVGNTFFSEILRGIQGVAAGAGITMLIGDTGRERAREAAYARDLRNGRADGALLLAAPVLAWDDLPHAGPGPAPVVRVSEALPGSPGLSVSIDNAAASEAAVAHLIGLGHRRIAHLAGPERNLLTEARREGWRRAHRAAGLPLDAGLEVAGDFGLESGRRAFAALAAMGPRPTAVACANDEGAMGLIAAAHEAGLRVPRDLSVAGFDDIHFAQAFIPALTTVRQPRAEMGEAAMRLLLAVWAGEAPDSVVLPFALVRRASTGAPPAGLA